MRNQQRGMTLVELLVVVTILGILLAVSVPLLQPMLQSRRTSNAAQVLAGVFQSARAKSLEEGKSYGVRLIPFIAAQTVSVQLRVQKENLAIYTNPLEIRVVVKKGVVKLMRFHDGQWKDYDTLLGAAAGAELTLLKNDYAAAMKWFQPGNRIQFNYLDSGVNYITNGTYFKLGKKGMDIILENAYRNEAAVNYEDLNLPEVGIDDEAMLFRITPPPVMTTWNPQVVMPRSTVVDLVFSGGETVGFTGEAKTADEIPAAFVAGDEVIVMFSPQGSVSRVYVKKGDGIQEELRDYPVNEMLFFCVGEWDRQVDADGKPMAEDGKSNLEAPATYWVTLHPKTGEVRITENAPVKATDKNERLIEARKFAKEHFFNVGGY